MIQKMEIMVNGFLEKVPANSTIASLLIHFKEDDTHVIVEYNGRFIYPAKYHEMTVEPGCEIEFINPDIGG